MAKLIVNLFIHIILEITGVSTLEWKCACFAWTIYFNFCHKPCKCNHWEVKEWWGLRLNLHLPQTKNNKIRNIGEVFTEVVNDVPHLWNYIFNHPNMHRKIMNFRLASYRVLTFIKRIHSFVRDDSPQRWCWTLPANFLHF